MKILSVKWPEKLTVGLVICGIALIYFIYLPVDYDFDGTVFSHYLRFGLMKNDLKTIHQPQHPLYMPVNYFLYKALQATLGYDVLEYFHLQLFALFFGLLTLRLSYKIIRQLTGRRFFRAAGIVLIAVSYGIWYYSVEAEVHTAGLFFVAAGFYLLFVKPVKPGGSHGWNHAQAAACFALAAGFHLTNGLIALSVLLVFLVEKKPFKKILCFFSFYAFLLLLELAIFARLSNINLLEFYKNQLSGQDALAGYKISYWSGFSTGALWGSLKSTAHGILFPASPVLAVLSIGLFLAAAALVIYTGTRRENENRKNYYRLWLWMLPYFIFFTAWDHRNIEFKLNVILPLLILFIASAAEFPQKKIKAVPVMGMVMIAVILAVGCGNFYFSILPANNINNNVNYRVAEAIAAATPPQSVIVIGGCGSDLSIYNKIYIPYFALRKTFILDWMPGKGLSLEEIRGQVLREVDRGTPVYFFSDILHEGKTLEQVLKNHDLKARDYFAFLETMNFKEKIPLINGYYLVKVAPGIH